MSPGRDRSVALAARLLLILAGPILFGVPASGDVWSYKEGEHGPNNWPGMCQSGTQQSPIDLDPETAIPGHFEPLVLLNYDRKVSANITNNGHTVMLTVEQPCEVVMAAGGLPGVYRLEQIHFHWKSEHTLRGRRWPLEMHMVHFDRQYLKLKEAVRHHQGLAVLAVLFYETEEPNKGLQTILDAIAKVSHTEKTPYKIPQTVSLEELVPEEKNRFYRYAGSLTTPNCDESVVWTVLTQPVPIGKDQVQQFHKVQAHNEPLRSNYRPLQKLDNRRIYLQHPSQESASNTKHHSWFITVLLLAMLSVTI